MNAIFTAILIASSFIMLLFSPSQLLPSLIAGSRSALNAAATLFCVYAVWMGLSAVAEDAGLTKGLSRAALPLCRRIFGTKSQKAAGYAAMNISCNLLGIGGAATPYAVKAIGEFEAEGNYRAQNLLFILNATSLQLIPATVISLRASAGSASAADITLPSLLSSALCTALGVCMFLLLSGKKKCNT